VLPFTERKTGFRMVVKTRVEDKRKSSRCTACVHQGMQTRMAIVEPLTMANPTSHPMSSKSTTGLPVLYDLKGMLYGNTS
jgi:type II secretory ATPase GspE/PulE/Tfp pilus assembly ATPase PilB-like protein